MRTQPASGTPFAPADSGAEIRMEEISACNLCGGSDFSPFATVPGRVTPRVYQVVRCEGCGLVFTNPRLNEQENALLYSEEYFRGHGFDAAVSYVSLMDDYDAVQKEGGSALRMIQVFRPEKDVRILDVGCATGALISVLEQEGYTNLAGIELSPYASQIARGNCRSTILTGDFLEYNFDHRKFDIIVATEVIEHIRNPLRFLQRVKSLLAHGGLFLYSTGNTSSPSARLMGKRWHYLCPEGHIMYFSPKTMRQYFAKVGLRAIDFRDLRREQRRQLLQAADDVFYSTLARSGQNNRGYVRFLTWLLARLPKLLSARLITLFVGKYKMPMAMNAG